MPDRHDEPTTDRSDEREPTDGSVSRRRILQVGGTSIAVGALGTVGASALNSDLANSIVIDGTVSSETATYEFLTSGEVALHPDLGSNSDASNINDGHVTGSVGNETHAYEFSGTLSYLDVGGTAEVTLRYGDSGATNTDRLEIVAASDGSVDYTISSPEQVEKVLDNGDRSANDGEDTVTENSDGTWSVSGSTANGYGDTYDFHGAIEHFEPVTGDFTLFFNGQETTVTELTGQQVDDGGTTVDREHWYSFEATGDAYADYYIEVEDGGDMIASTVDDATIETDFHWINDDGTKAAGRVDPGETHAYAFDTLVADVTIDGVADATVDGSPSDLSNYPTDSASGDHWKGYFPWHLEGETREHWYSFEATGDGYVDYYIEVEDGGDVIPSLENDAIVEYEFFWIGDGGTKAAGRIDPGETHAYAFDTLVQDVTVEGGQVDVLVNGSPSDLGYYPRDGASGDGWKSGFPWQDDGDGVTTTTETSGEGTVGGGPGYANTVPASDADATVRTSSELEDALASAGSGDVVYVPGSESIGLGNQSYDVPSGVTLASDRGIDGATGGLLYTDSEPGELLRLHGSARLTGLRVRGPHPGDDWSGDSSAGGAETLGAGEIDNCEVWGFSHHGIQADSGDGAHIHHNVVRENNTAGLGYGVAVSSGTPVIEYNYFNYNRHSVATAGNNPGYVCRYNHFGPTEVMHNIDAHDPAGIRYEIHNNVVETVRREWDDNLNHSIDIRGVPDDVAVMTDNWFFNDNAPDPNGSPDVGGQTIVQENVSSWTNMDFHDNYYGENANVTYSDIIPGYDGWRS